MKTAITRLITAGAVALVFVASACMSPLPTDPGEARGPTSVTVPGDPPDEVVKH